MATGLVTAGNGAAALLTAPLLNMLINQYGVLSALNTTGLVFIAIAVLCGMVCRSAPNDYRPAGWTPSTSHDQADHSLNWQAMMKSPVFYLMVTLMASGALSGLMIAANASPIGQYMFALSASTAALYVGLYAASNAAGRFIWGAVSDRIGGANALIVIFLLIASMLMLLASSTTTTGFAVAICGIGIAFGGVMGVFPSLVSQRFGARYFGVNYGIMFCGYAIAAAIGPQLAVSMAAANGGDFSQAFYIAIIICLVGAALAVLLSRSLLQWRCAQAQG